MNEGVMCEGCAKKESAAEGVERPYIKALAEATAPKDPVARARMRMNDAAKRGGLDELVKATEKRIKATHDSQKVDGIVAALDQTIARLKSLRRLAQMKA